MADVVLSLPDEQRELAEQAARARGYESLNAYILALIAADLEMLDEPDVDPVQLFREGWSDAMAGRVHPISELWDDVDSE